MSESKSKKIEQEEELVMEIMAALINSIIAFSAGAIGVERYRMLITAMVNNEHFWKNLKMDMAMAKNMTKRSH